MPFHYTEKIYYGNSLPLPGEYKQGDLFIDLNDALVYLHDGTDWIVVGTDPTVSNFDTYDDLRASPTPSSPIILIGGRDTPGDGGQGFFIRDPLNRADNDGTVLVDADGQSWQRVFIGAVFAKWFYGNTPFNFTPAEMDNLIDVVYNYHGHGHIDWTGVDVQVNASYEYTIPRSVKFENIHITIGLTHTISFIAEDGTRSEFIGLSTTGGYGFGIAANGNGTLQVRNSVFDTKTLVTTGGIVDQSIFLKANNTVSGRGVLRNSIIMGINTTLRDNAMAIGNYFYVYEPMYGSTATITGNAFVVGNRFYTRVTNPGSGASGTVSINYADRVVFVANYVELERSTYPYPFTLNNPDTVFVSGNTFVSVTHGGQDSMQLTFSTDAGAVSIVNNLFMTVNGRGNYGVRIRGGGKANMILANNGFFNFGTRAGDGVQRRNGTGNIKIVGNIFYNWARGIYKYDSATTNGVIEGHSNVFSSSGGVSDPDYTNTTADTVWG